VWVSKKISGPTQQPSGCKSRQLDHKNASYISLKSYIPAGQACLNKMGSKKQRDFERSEKHVFVWVSKKTPGPTQQPFRLQVTTAGSQKMSK